MQQETAIDWAAGLPTTPHARVVMIVLDAFGPEFLDAAETPALHALAAAGGFAPGGGLAELMSSTGPGHATLLTGTRPRVHGLLANRLFGADGEIERDVRIQVPSILDQLHAAGRKVRVAVSDAHILVTINADGAIWAWPDAKTVAENTTPEKKYMPDGLTAGVVVDALATGHEFVFAQLQDVDTAAHATGLDSERSRAARRMNDRAIAEIVAAARVDWDRTLLIVLSDHRIETVVSETPIRLADALQGLARVIEDGSGALVEPLDGVDHGLVCLRALAVPGVAGIARLTDAHFAASAEPGRVFGRDTPITTRAAHGNATSRPCLAIVGGGHPAVPVLAERMRMGPPPLHIWAGVVQAALGESGR